MELSFAATAWGWGLLSLALPILIHFFASRQQQPRRFAGMRFLPPGVEQGRARRISDWLLLLLRLLLLAVLVMALMAPTLRYPEAREHHWLLRHPALPAISDSAAGSASTSDAMPAYWLCPNAELQPLSASCARNETATTQPVGESFLLDLLQLATREPSLAEVTVQVPPQLATAPLTLPTLPFVVHWQFVAVDAPVPAVTWPVSGPADYGPLFAAANRIDAAARWRWQSAEGTGVDDRGSGEAERALVIGEDDRRARVRWHNQPLPWQDSTHSDTTLQFHVEGAALHLRVTDAATLRTEPARFARLLQLTDAWLARGQWRYHEDSAMVLAGLSASSAQATGMQTLTLQSLLLLLAVLLLFAERGLAYARR